MMTPKKPLPRLPLEGMLDLTYRCDNHCLHCWLWVSSTTQEIQAELSFEEIRRIVDEARQMGCQAWKISGGEPMLRPDFPEIFDYITRKAEHYNLSTNGGLITPEITQLMTRRGRSSRGRWLTAPSHTTGRAGPHPAVH
jgi:MoaA/NifB/PqqE/SkfB family radical SAM enzyme